MVNADARRMHSTYVVPAEAGTQVRGGPKNLDSRLRGNDVVTEITAENGNLKSNSGTSTNMTTNGSSRRAIPCCPY